MAARSVTRVVCSSARSRLWKASVRARRGSEVPHGPEQGEGSRLKKPECGVAHWHCLNAKATSLEPGPRPDRGRSPETARTWRGAANRGRGMGPDRSAVGRGTGLDGKRKLDLERWESLKASRKGIDSDRHRPRFGMHTTHNQRSRTTPTHRYEQFQFAPPEG
eukprot:1515841-Prymnesium_polylepis.1